MQNLARVKYCSLEKLTRWLSSAISERIGVISVPFCKGQLQDGVDQGPAVLRKYGLLEKLKSISSKKNFTDYGDLLYTPEIFGNMKNMNHCDEVFGCNKVLFKKVQEVLKKNDQFLVLGGDHSVGFGSVAGHLMHNPNLALIWVDAHADINLPTTSPTGNMHGMPVSMFIEELKQFWEYVSAIKWAKNRISAKRIAFIGLRDLDDFERAILQKLGICAFGMSSIERYGIHEIVNMALKSIDPENNLKFHVSFDIDAIDSLQSPATGTAVSGGLTLREGIYIMERLAETGRITGVDLVEVNPKIGSEKDIEHTVFAAIQVIKAAFGFDPLKNDEHLILDDFL